MPKCINCGQETYICLCDKCKSTVDIEKLCDSIMEYTPGLGQNMFWDDILAELYDPDNFRYVVFALSDEFPSPRKESNVYFAWSLIKELY